MRDRARTWRSAFSPRLARSSCSRYISRFEERASRGQNGCAGSASAHRRRRLYRKKNGTWRLTCEGRRCSTHRCGLPPFGPQLGCVFFSCACPWHMQPHFQPSLPRPPRLPSPPPQQEHKDTDLTRIQADMRYLTRACGMCHRGRMGRVCRRGKGAWRRAAPRPWQKCSTVSARVFC